MPAKTVIIAALAALVLFLIALGLQGDAGAGISRWMASLHGQRTHR